MFPHNYDEIGDFVEGMAKVKLNGMWGFINTKGTEIISPKYKAVENFENGLSLVKTSKSAGFIDKNGNEYWED